MNDLENPNCDNDRCISKTGEVRKLPMSRDPMGGNLILCKTCFLHEIAWRGERNEELEGDVRFQLPKWDELEVYQP